MDTLFNFLIRLGMIPLFMFLIFIPLSWMITGKIEIKHGLIGLAGILTLLAVAFGNKNLNIALGICGALILLIAFYPYAQSQLARASFHTLDVEKLDKAFQALAARPDSAPIYFQIAQTLHDLGLAGHAITIAERTLANIPSNDPLRINNVRDMFRSEAYRLKRWKEESYHPSEYRKIRCKRCGTLNEVGELACKGCQGPYLLDHFRGTNMEARTTGRLIAAYGILAFTLGGSIFIAQKLSAPLSHIFFVSCYLAAGLMLWALFKTTIRSYDNVVDI